MKTELLKLFGSLCILLETRYNTTFKRGGSNSKLGLWNVPNPVQVTILPIEAAFVGRDVFSKDVHDEPMTRAQLIACASNCRFRTNKALAYDGLTRIGNKPCYVNPLYLKAKAEKARATYFGGNPEVELSNYFLRNSVWGDAGRLNAEGQYFLLELILNASSHTSYVSDFAHLIPDFQGLTLASCQTSTDVNQAILHGFRGYLGTREARDYAKAQGMKVFTCPHSKKNLARNKAPTCTECPTPCSGTRWIAAPNL